jgi:hypothetical protein
MWPRIVAASHASPTARMRLGGRRTLAEHRGVSSPATRLLPPPSRRSLLSVDKALHGLCPLRRPQGTPRVPGSPAATSCGSKRVSSTTPQQGGSGVGERSRSIGAYPRPRRDFCRPRAGAACCPWTKPSMAFVHSGDRRERQGSLGRRLPLPAAANVFRPQLRNREARGSANARGASGRILARDATFAAPEPAQLVVRGQSPPWQPPRPIDSPPQWLVA